MNRDVLIREIRTVADRLDRPPLASEIDEFGEFPKEDYYAEFGDWLSSLQEAGIDCENHVVQSIQQAASDLGRAPKVNEMESYSRYARNYYIKHFDSWDAALRQSGCKLVTQDELLENLSQVREKLGRVPTAKDLDNHGKYSWQQYQKRFESLDDVLNSAGYDLNQSLLDDLKEIVIETGHSPPTVAEIEEHSEYYYGLYNKYFDTLPAAVDQLRARGDYPGVVDDDTPDELLESLSKKARDRLRELVELQPTSNSKLVEKWNLPDGRTVHQYLESELEKFYYRDEDAYIRVTDAAEAIVHQMPQDGDSDSSESDGNSPSDTTGEPSTDKDDITTTPDGPVNTDDGDDSSERADAETRFDVEKDDLEEDDYSNRIDEVLRDLFSSN